MVLATLLALAVAPAAWGWGRTGHLVICHLAYSETTPEARDLLAELGLGGRKKFSRGCLWADEIREADRPETATYHYVNIPAASTGFDKARDCPADDCLPWALAHFVEIAADPESGRQERSEAIRFLAHFVGDLHQPLHAGRPEDRGGNEIAVCFRGDCGDPDRPLNLHRFWDVHLVEEEGVGWRRLARRLGRRAGAETPIPRSSPALDILGWLDESYRLGETFTYPGVTGKELSEAYVRTAREHAAERMRTAGVRLARLLTAIARGDDLVAELEASDAGR